MSTSSARPLSGQVAVVTGASSGLGQATAHRLAADGAAVALLARRADDLLSTQTAIAELGGSALALPTDLADAAAIEAVVSSVAAELRRIDVLVNAAATDVPGPVEALDRHGWDRVIAVNLTAPFLLAKAVWPHMRRAGGGTIINISSVAGRRGWANAAAYCATKFALTGLTQSLAAEGRPDGIRACVVYPGAMATAWGVWDSAQRESSVGSDLSANEALPAGEVADLIAWIAAAPANLVLNEATVTPLLEHGWPQISDASATWIQRSGDVCCAGDSQLASATARADSPPETNRGRDQIRLAVSTSLGPQSWCDASALADAYPVGPQSIPTGVEPLLQHDRSHRRLDLRLPGGDHHTHQHRQQQRHRLRRGQISRANHDHGPDDNRDCEQAHHRSRDAYRAAA